MDTDWDVNAILGHIKRNGVVYYLVKWGASEEPEHMLNHCPEKIKQYWDNLLRDSTVSSSTCTTEAIEITTHPNLSTLQDTPKTADSKLVSVQTQTDSNPNKKKVLNSPNKPKKMRTKQLQRHQTPFCEPCNKSFFNVGSLKRHQKEIHQSNNQFKCTICQTGFGRKNALDTHLFRCKFKLQNLLFWKW